MRWFIIVALFVSACSSDSTGPSTLNVAGTWTASLSNLSGSGASCSSTAPTTLSINQSGASFSGSYSGGELTCSGPGGSFSQFVGNGTILNGTLSGSNVAFDLDTPDYHLTGSVNGSSMSGTAHWTINTGSELITLNGNWGAAR